MAKLIITRGTTLGGRLYVVGESVSVKEVTAFELMRRDCAKRERETTPPKPKNKPATKPKNKMTAPKAAKLFD